MSSKSSTTLPGSSAGNGTNKQPLKKHEPLPGSLEYQIQERNLRIKKIQEEREKQRTLSIFLRGVRHQRPVVHYPEAVGRNTNNNTIQLQQRAPLPVVKAASAKIRPPSPALSPSTKIKKSKSTGATPKKSLRAVNIPTTATPPKIKTAKKILSSPGRKHSTSLLSRRPSTSLSSSKHPRKPSKTSFTGLKLGKKHSNVGTSRKISKYSIRGSSHKIKSKKSKSNDSLSSLKGKTPSKPRVTFSKTNLTTTKKRGEFYCPVVTPVSILKNRQKINELCKSTLKLTTESKENFKNQPSTSSKKERNNFGESMLNWSILPAKITSESESTSSVPVPDLPLCNALPGTKEWDDYWVSFNEALEKYHLDMKKFEKDGERKFQDDMAIFRKEARKLAAENEMFKKFGEKGVELGLVPPPPINIKELKGLQLYNGYILKSKNIKGTVSNHPGSTQGIHLEVNINKANPEKILIEKDHNLLTLSIDKDTYLRIGTPIGKLAGDIEVWPPMDGLIILDAP